MNNTTKTMSTLDRAVLFLGTGMMLAWFLGIGIGGFVVLLAIAAGTLVYQAHTLTIVLSSFVMVPLMLTLLWGALMLAGVIWEKWGVQLSVSEQSGPENRVRLSYIPNLPVARGGFYTPVALQGGGRSKDEVTYELGGDPQTSLLRGLSFLATGNSGFGGLKVAAWWVP